MGHSESVQLALWPDTVHLIRVRPEKHEKRFYRMTLWPDLFGNAILIREWGRIGQPGQVRQDRHPDPGAALNALTTLARRKRQRGYTGGSM